MNEFFASSKVPWNSLKEAFLWLGAIIIATFFMHNVTRYFKERGTI